MAHVGSNHCHRRLWQLRPLTDRCRGIQHQRRPHIGEAGCVGCDAAKTLWRDICRLPRETPRWLLLRKSRCKVRHVLPRPACNLQHQAARGWQQPLQLGQDWLLVAVCCGRCVEKGGGGRGAPGWSRTRAHSVGTCRAGQGICGMAAHRKHRAHTSTCCGRHQLCLDLWRPGLVRIACRSLHRAAAAVVPPVAAACPQMLPPLLVLVVAEDQAVRASTRSTMQRTTGDTARRSCKTTRSAARHAWQAVTRKCCTCLLSSVFIRGVFFNPRGGIRGAQATRAAPLHDHTLQSRM